MAAVLKRPSRPVTDATRAPIRTDAVASLDLLAPRRAQWNALAAISPTSTVFQTFEWHAAWWAAFGGAAQPLVVVAEADGQLAGLAPLMLSRQRVAGRRRRVLQFIGLNASDYCDLIFDPARPEVVTAIVQWLLDHAHAWDVLDLRNLADGAAALDLPALFARRGYYSDVRYWTQAPTWRFGDAAADRKLVGKKSLRRHHNFFARQGELEFLNLERAEDVLPWLEPFFEQHIGRWAATDTPSQFRDPAQRQFYREMVTALAPEGWLLFSVVLFQGTPLAFHLGFDYGERIIWYKPAYNVAFARHSPGEVLIKGLLELALARRVAEFDFSCGEEEFKQRFANHARTIRSVHVARDPLTFYGDRLLFDLRSWAKRSPLLKRLALRARRLTGRA